jgi:hypothetical protein
MGQLRGTKSPGDPAGRGEAKPNRRGRRGISLSHAFGIVIPFLRVTSLVLATRTIT